MRFVIKIFLFFYATQECQGDYWPDFFSLLNILNILIFSFRAIRYIFSFDDGMLENSFSNNFMIDENDDVQDIQTVKEHLLKHFKIKTKEELMNILYGPNFQKSYIASFTKLLAECTGFFFLFFYIINKGWVEPGPFGIFLSFCELFFFLSGFDISLNSDID